MLDRCFSSETGAVRKRWAAACFFIRVEASDALRQSKGWKSDLKKKGDEGFFVIGVFFCWLCFFFF